MVEDGTSAITAECSGHDVVDFTILADGTAGVGTEVAGGLADAGVLVLPFLFLAFSTSFEELLQPLVTIFLEFADAEREAKAVFLEKDGHKDGITRLGSLQDLAGLDGGDLLGLSFENAPQHAIERAGGVAG